MGSSGSIDEEQWEKLQKTKLTTDKMENVFMKFSGQKSSLNRGDFHDILLELEKYGLKKMSDTPFANQLFDALDINKDGTIDKNEFLSGMTILSSGTDEEKAKILFRLFDKNGDGFISYKEVYDLTLSMHHCLYYSLVSRILSKLQKQGMNVSGERTKYDTMYREKFEPEFVEKAKAHFKSLCDYDLDHNKEIEESEFTEFLKKSGDMRVNVELGYKDKSLPKVLTAEFLLTSFLS